MTTLTRQVLDIAGTPSSVLRGGSSSTPIVFVHGGTPGITPYCSGAHLWESCLPQFAREFAVVAVDLPGFGQTGITSDGLTVDAMARHVRATLRALDIQRCHVVGHDTGGLVALMLACEQPELVAAVTAVSSTAAAPSGDGVDEVALAYPLHPMWQRSSQRVALESISFAHHHVDDALLNACVAAASFPPHQDALARMAQGAHADSWIPSVMRAKSRLFETCRNAGVPVPTQVVWGTHDPLGTLDRGLW
ncbi:MAG TPA: alpha/beta fold hydrolase, partial [Ramlibacter sp.]|nr:alpha/beta fold hydrolase [Ramlibacter sp.]